MSGRLVLLYLVVVELLTFVFELTVLSEVVRPSVAVLGELLTSILPCGLELLCVPEPLTTSELLRFLSTT